MEVILGSIVNYISSLSAAYPTLVGIMAIAYMVGLVLKLVLTGLKAFVLESPSKDDDAKLAKFEQSQLSKTIYFIIDLLIRFKK